MDVKFGYNDEGNSFFGRIYRPIAKVTFSSLDLSKLVDVWMIVDTGADFSILPAHFAEKLRVNFEKDCVKDATSGVGGEQTIYLLKKPLEAKVGYFSRKVPVAFFDSNEIPPLLGRLGFLETFDAEFLKKHAVVF